jgi:hypothetical protein
MSYRYSETPISRQTREGYEANRVSSKDHAERNTSQSEFHRRHFELAEVVNVVRDSDDPDYARNEDIGNAKVRRVRSEFDRPKDDLSYAKPITGRVNAWPIENELVLVTTLHQQLFYLQTANWRKNVHQNAAPLFSVNQIESGNEKQQSYDNASKGVTRSTTSSTEKVDPEGDRFEVRTDVKPLRHRPGDMALEGRVGNSIRLGRDSEMNPLIQMRVGQRDPVENADFLEPFFEDINEDPTSLYLTSPDVEFPLEPEDTSEPLEPATIDFDDHLNSAESPPENYNGAQILAASNRIALNAKERQLVGFSSGETSWVTLENFTVDARQKIKTLSINGHLHVSESDFDVLPEGSIHLATESENEPVARGQQTLDRLVALLQQLLVETHSTPVGPSGPPLPDSQQEYQRILQKAKQTIRSEKVYLDEPGESFQRPA